MEVVEAVASRTDHSIEDDEAGAMRAELAAASESRREEEAAELARENAEAAQRLEEAMATVDDNIEDEPAGIMRKELAAASEARREEEAEELARQNAEVAERLDAAGPKTDDNIEDEPAGMMRKELAVSSASRRSSLNEELARQNMAAARRRSLIGARIDTTIDDEAAGSARRKLQDLASARRAAAAAELRKHNEDMRQRIHAIKVRSDEGTYKLSVVDLAPPVSLHSERGSETWRASYVKFEVEQENQAAADLERRRRAELRGDAAQQRDEWMSEARSRVHERKRRERRLRKAQDAVVKANRKQVRVAKTELQLLEEQRQVRDRHYHETARARVVEAAQLDDRLDAEEAARAARDREEGTRLRLAVAQARLERRDEIYLENRELVETAISARSGPLSARSACFTPRRGNAKREQSKDWHRQKQESEGEYLSRARAFRELAMRQRESAKKSMLRLLKTRKKSAAKERANDYRVNDTKVRTLENKRQDVANVYKSRFASKGEVDRMWRAAQRRTVAEILAEDEPEEEEEQEPVEEAAAPSSEQGGEEDYAEDGEERLEQDEEEEGEDGAPIRRRRNSVTSRRHDPYADDYVFDPERSDFYERSSGGDGSASLVA